jgi:hypothetical protein
MAQSGTVQPLPRISGQIIINELIRNMELGRLELGYSILVPCIFSVYLHPDDYVRVDCQSSPYRNLTTSSTGCPWNAPHSYSDGVVCADSATYSDFIPLVTPFSGRPTMTMSDATFVHTTFAWGWGSAFVLCGVPANAFELFRPQAGTSIYNQIVQVLNGY